MTILVQPHLQLHAVQVRGTFNENKIKSQVGLQEVGQFSPM